MSFLARPIRLNKGHTKKSTKVESFQLFFFFFYISPNGFQCKDLSINISSHKMLINTFSSSPISLTAQQARAAMKTGEHTVDADSGS